MIKNKDAIAEKSVDKFAEAKARMKAALDKSAPGDSNTTCVTGTSNGPTAAPAGSNAPPNPSQIPEAMKSAEEASKAEQQPTP